MLEKKLNDEKKKNMVFEGNAVSLVGTLISNPEYSHTAHGETFYTVLIDVQRTSNNTDTLPIIISKRILDVNNFKKSDTCYLTGQLRSYNRRIANKSKLILVIFAHYIIHYLAKNDDNQIVLDGYICKKPTFRRTPLGREICDILLATNRLHNKSDYLPTISWGRNAIYASQLKTGDHIIATGRVQSRLYQKKLPDFNIEERVAYEVSISSLFKVEDDMKFVS